MDWLLTVAVCLVLSAAVFAIVFSMIRMSRKGRSPSCGGNCGACANCRACCAARSVKEKGRCA